jgi:hypothetical protein
MKRAFVTTGATLDIGTKRTFRDCCQESAFGGNADIDQPPLSNLDF